MTDPGDERAAVFERLLAAWQGEPETVAMVLTEDYAGHMLHLADGERTAASYPGWIERFQLENPGTEFHVVDQGREGDRLWTRLVARRGDGSVANGMNESRFVGERIAEEWAMWSPWRSA